MNLNIGNIGVWGFRHYEFLKQNRLSTVGVMRVNGTLDLKKRFSSRLIINQNHRLNRWF